MIGLIIPSGFAEEIEQTFEVIFDETDYKLEYENNFVVPIKLHVSNHDYKITPEYFIRFQGQTIDHYTWSNVNSGEFTSYLLIDRNWASGIYKINLKYDETYLDPLTFKIYRDTDSIVEQKQVEEVKEEIITNVKLPTEKIVIPDKPPSWFVLNPFPLPMEAEIAHETTGGYLWLNILDPDNKKSIYKLRILDDGSFSTGLTLDSTWKSGTYKITGELKNKEIFDGEFVIDNPRIKPNKEVEISYPTSIVLSSQTAGEFEVLNVQGTTDAPTENILVTITKPDKSVEEFNVTVANGSYSTDIVLSTGYTVWEYGKYTLNIEYTDQILSSTKFEINQSGEAVFPKETGSMISGSEGELEKLAEFDVGEYQTDSFTISGKVDDYKSGTNISVSIVKPDKTKQEIQTYANSDGEYSIPIVLDEMWPKGEYTIYTTYRDFVDSPVSFTISGKITDVVIDETTKKISTEQNVIDIVPQIVSLPSAGGHTDVVIEGNLGKDMIKEFGKRFAKIPIIMTMPDKTTKQLLIRANEQGDFIVNTAITSKWKEGDYSFSMKKDGEMTQFAMISIINDNPNTEDKVDILVESAMPGSAYAKVDSFVLENNKVEYYLRTNHITFFGSVADDNLGRVTVTVLKHDGTTVKLHPKILRDNSFTGTVSIDDRWPQGSYEIIATQGDHEIGHTEFLITSTNQVVVHLDDMTSISEDMFLDSNGVELSIKGTPLFGEKIKINLQAPDGSIEQFIQSSTTPISIGGKIVYSGFVKKIAIENDWFAGTYKATAMQGNSNLGTALIQIIPFSPTWLQDQTKLWLDGDITDWQYKNRLRTIAEHGILELPDASDAKTDLPAWLKESAKMYVNDETPQSAYLNSLQYLVDSGLLNASS